MKYLSRMIALMGIFLFSPLLAEDHSGKWSFVEDESNPDYMTQISKASITSIINESTFEEVFPNLTFYCTKNNPDPVLQINWKRFISVSYTHLRAHETPEHLVCRLLLEKTKTINTNA